MKRFIDWLKYQLSCFRIQNIQIGYSVDVEPWHDGHAANLYAFLDTPTGKLFAQRLKKFEIEMNSWAVDVDHERFSSRRAFIANGVELAHKKILTMSRKPEEEKVDPKDMEKFFYRRMGLFKSN